MTPFLQEGQNVSTHQTSKTASKDNFIYISPTVGKSVQLALKAARLNTCVFVSGSRGTGKKALALEIHKHSKVHYGPFMYLHCKSLSDKVLRTELFGFKGDEMTSSYEGVFRKADGGTLVLDDVSALPSSVQEEISQYIQTGCVTPVGSEQSIPVKTRLIFTVPEKNISNVGLYKKLEYVEPMNIPLPDLSERKEDIADLTRYFLNNSKNSNGHQNIQITDAALDSLKCYKWPGNVRELKNICEHAQIFCNNNEITVNDLPRKILDTNECAVQIKYDPSLKLSDINRLYILSALQYFPSKKKAAQALGVTVKTLYNRIHEYGIFDRYAIHSKD